MKKKLHIQLTKNNLNYEAIGYAYFDVKTSENVINDDGRIITEYFEDIEYSDIILDEVSVFDIDMNLVYQGNAMQRHYELFEKIVKEADIDFTREEINIEL